MTATAVAKPSLLPPLADYIGAIRKAACDPKLRAIAAREFGYIMVDPKRNPLSADHGTHLLRASEFGECSLQFAAKAHGLLDLERDSDSRVLMDNGSIMGAWLACLLKAALEADGALIVLLEQSVEYRGASGHVDAAVVYGFTEEGPDYDPVEFKTVRGGGAITPPDKRALYQCLQTGGYGAALESQRFTIIVWGLNVGNNKAGVPYPKMQQFSYETADFAPLVDSEIGRLRALQELPREVVLDAEKMVDLADTEDVFRCESCCFSKCSRNMNPARFAL